jgi:short-subunit dehydrogenase
MSLPQTPSFGLSGKHALVTGASSGIGLACAVALAEAGAEVTLAARSAGKLEAIAEELRGKTRVEIFVTDVSDTETCVDLFKKADFEFGRIDILVNNAGYRKRGLVESLAAEDLGKIIDVNLKAPIILSRMALPYLRDGAEGAIINVGSLAGRAPIPGSAAYSASKSGLRAFTFALAEELRDTNIKFAVVSPGPIDAGFIMADIDQVSDLTFSQPISTADEVAQAILDLCGNNQREQSMPALSGFLTTLMYLMPWLGSFVRPALQRKGQRVKQRLKREAKATAKLESGEM